MGMVELWRLAGCKGNSTSDRLHCRTFVASTSAFREIRWGFRSISQPCWTGRVPTCAVSPKAWEHARDRPTLSRLALHAHRCRCPMSRVDRPRDGADRVTPRTAGAHQLGWAPHRNTGSLVPFMANVISPEVVSVRDRLLESMRPRLRVLSSIERHGDREAFRRAAALKPWLSRPSSASSANS